MGAWFRWIREIWLGRRALGQTTERVTESLINNTHDIFTITGGRILVTQIVGQVTATVVNACQIRLWGTPDAVTFAAASPRLMCANLLVQGYDPGDLLGIDGINTSAMLPPAASAVVEAQTMGVVAQIGAIRLECDTLDAAAFIRWTLKWIPFDAGAAVAPA